MSEVDFLCKDSFKLLFDDSSNIILLIDSDSGQIVNCNQVAVDYYKYSYEELTSLNIRDINTSSNESVQFDLNKACSNERNIFNFIHRLSTGEFRRVEVKSSPVIINNKKYVFSIISDISEKNRTHLLMTGLFYDSPNAIVIVDNQKKILAVNNSFTKLFGYQLDEIINKPIDEFILNTNQLDLMINFKKVMSGKEVKQSNLRKTKQNKMVNVEIHAKPCIIGKEVVGALVVYTKKQHLLAMVSIKYKLKLLFSKIIEMKS